MAVKLISGFISAALVLAFLGSFAFKLKGEYALYVAVLVGIVLMLVDLWQSLKSAE